jgi:hypothetical protein
MNKREKELTDKEISLYKKEKMLAVDIEVQQKITTNWEKVQAARKENFQNKAKLDTEIAKLEAKKEALAEVLAIKDQEITLLKSLLAESIKALQTIKTSA